MGVFVPKFRLFDVGSLDIWFSEIKIRLIDAEDRGFALGKMILELVSTETLIICCDAINIMVEKTNSLKVILYFILEKRFFRIRLGRRARS